MPSGQRFGQHHGRYILLDCNAVLEGTSAPTGLSQFPPVVIAPSSEASSRLSDPHAGVLNLSTRAGHGGFRRRYSRRFEYRSSRGRHITADVSDDTAARLINVCFAPLCGLKSDISRGPRSATTGLMHRSKGDPYRVPSIASGLLRSRFEGCDLIIKPRKLLPPLRIAWCDGDQPRHYFASFAELDRRFGDFATF